MGKRERENERTKTTSDFFPFLVFRLFVFFARRATSAQRQRGARGWLFFCFASVHSDLFLAFLLFLSFNTTAVGVAGRRRRPLDCCCSRSRIRRGRSRPSSPGPAGPRRRPSRARTSRRRGLCPGRRPRGAAGGDGRRRRKRGGDDGGRGGLAPPPLLRPRPPRACAAKPLCPGAA